MRTSAFFDTKKMFFFSKFIVCLHGQGKERVELVPTFCGQEGGVNFSQFCADVLCG